jgi:phosphoglucomutase
MKKILLVILLSLPLNLFAVEKTKEEKVAKYVLENIQKDYMTCYSFYKIAAESFKKAGKEKKIIEGLEKSADVTLKFNHDLGEVLGMPSKIMTKKTKIKIDELTVIAKKDFSSLTNQYGLMCKKLVENQKQRIDYWEVKGNKIIK